MTVLLKFIASLAVVLSNKAVPWLLALCMLLCAFNGHTHLLNMSKVQIEVQADGSVMANFTLDLTRELGSAEAYYALSQSQQPGSQPFMQDALSRLIASTHLQHNEQFLQWQLSSVSMPDNPKEDFLSGVAWPMTHIQLTAHLADNSLNSGALSVRFSGDYKYEEPIALTFLQASSGRKMSRWLVPNQLSPLFALNAQSQIQLEQTSADWPWQVWFDYLYLGMKHIVPMGWDHVLFVLGLFLGMRSVRQLLCLITGFTFAHSVTLALSSYGAIVLSPAIVEPLIALSILWVAVENLVFRQAQRWRIITVFMFGLLHGLGFAQSLRELGLPTDSFLGALISFNLGVELAQIGVVLSAFALVGWLRSKTIWRSRVVVPASAVISFMAFYWILNRVI